MNPRTSPDHRIYLDCCATTPLDTRVLDKMLPFFSDTFGNASSRDHSFGWDANDAVEAARSSVAELVGGGTADILFTSGATESINLALKGVAAAFRAKGNHIITTEVEHSAVLETCRHLEANGIDITRLPVDGEGRIDLQALEEAIRPSTILISVMHANNETGVVFPVAGIGRIAHNRDVLFFTDATQAVGKLSIDFPSAFVDLAAFTAHKFYGPKGAGALFIGNPGLRKKLSPLHHGGGHEGGLRSGTLNVPAIVGFGEACRIAIEEMGADAKKCRFLRDRFEQAIAEKVPDAFINGGNAERLPHISNISFPGCNARDILRKIGSIALATAAACSSAKSGTSHVLRAMGKHPEAIDGALRMSCGRFTTEFDIDSVVEKLWCTRRRM
jgi:cysteine desulfurase